MLNLLISFDDPTERLLYGEPDPWLQAVRVPARPCSNSEEIAATQPREAGSQPDRGRSGYQSEIPVPHSGRPARSAGHPMDPIRPVRTATPEPATRRRRHRRTPGHRPSQGWIWRTFHRAGERPNLINLHNLPPDWSVRAALQNAGIDPGNYEGAERRASEQSCDRWPAARSIEEANRISSTPAASCRTEI